MQNRKFWLKTAHRVRLRLVVLKKTEAIASIAKEPSNFFRKDFRDSEVLAVIAAKTKF